MTRAVRQQILLVGQPDSPELAPAVAWLRLHARCEEVGTSREVDPDAIIFCLARPGQIVRAKVEDLHQTYPLSQLFSLIGPWCEGEVRTGKPAPGVTRIYWHQWHVRLPQELIRLSQSTAARLPRSATEVDVQLCRPAPNRATRPALIGVVSRRQTDFEAIAVAIDAGGHHAVWISPDDALPVLKLDALVIDGEQPAASARFGRLPTILLAGFPRPEDIEPRGAKPWVEIMAKPYQIPDLLTRLSELLALSAAAVPQSSAAA
jgi:hypothetical protein